MAASALRADSTLSPTLVRTNTQCSFEFILAFFTFKVFADKFKTLQWCLVLYLFAGKTLSRFQKFGGPPGKSQKKVFAFSKPTRTDIFF